MHLHLAMHESTGCLAIIHELPSALFVKEQYASNVWPQSVTQLSALSDKPFNQHHTSYIRLTQYQQLHILYIIQAMEERSCEGIHKARDIRHRGLMKGRQVEATESLHLYYANRQHRFGHRAD